MENQNKFVSEKRRLFFKQITGGMFGLSVGLGLPSKLKAEGKRAEKAKLIINHIEKIKFRVPIKPGMWCSPEYGPDALSRFWEGDKSILKIYGENGFIGLGETGRNYNKKALEENIRFLTGRDIFSLNFAHPNLSLPQGATSSAFEMAIFDLIGKTWGVPVYQLLGGRYQDKVAVTYWTGRWNGQDMEKIARRCKYMGYQSLKFKWRPGDPIIEELRAIEKVDPEINVTVDLNRHYETPEEFLPLAKQLERFNIKAIEDPVPLRMDWYASIREKVNIPIAITTGDPSKVIECIKAGACDCFNFGGHMRHFVRLCAVADAAGIQTWHGSGSELGVRDTSFIHAIAATPNCTIASDVLGYFIREDDLLSKSFTVENGYATVPIDPGLGIELDEDALKKYRV
ncbi:mandelate racemase/muconate lactonizing enzyme family protein [Candidatus Latescibacterota bacterium]